MKMEKMYGDKAGQLPFAVSRANDATLIEQIVEGVRTAIEGGAYKPGDRLPTTREMAGLLGVSRIVVERAFARLKDRNYIRARPHEGVIVQDADVKLWRGTVLVVTTSHTGSYYPNVFAGEVKGRLLRAGYLCAQLSVDSFSPGQPDLSALKAHLRGPVSLAVVLFSSPRVEDCLSEAGVPFVVVGGGRAVRGGCCGTVTLDWGLSLPAFVGHCLASHVESVLQVSVRRRETVDVSRALEKSGIACERLLVREPDDRLKPQNVEMASFAALKRRLAADRSFPELVFFADDHLAAGGLWALAEAGLSAPEDVKVVSWTNRGNAPAYLRRLTAMEMDARKHAGLVADQALAWLAKGKMAEGVVLGPDYVRGETFA